MAKNNPILDGFLAGSAVSAVSGGRDPNKGSNAFFIGALTAYRSAKQNEAIDRDERAQRRHHAALESQSQEMSSRLAELEARQMQAHEAQEQQRRYVASIRQYIVAAEQWLQQADDRSSSSWEFARFWLFSRAIQLGMSNFDIGLDEQRAIGQIAERLANLERKAARSPARMIACIVGLARSVAIWSALATQPGREVSPDELRSSAKQYILRMKRARRLGLLGESSNGAGITLASSANGFVVDCSGIYPELEVLHTVSGSGVAPFSKKLVQHLHSEILKSRSEPPPSITVTHPALEKKGGWLFAMAIEPGSYVNKGDLIAAVEPNVATEHTIEVTAPENGHIGEIHYEEGLSLKNGARIATYLSVNYSGNDSTDTPAVRTSEGADESNGGAQDTDNASIVDQARAARVLPILEYMLYASVMLLVGGLVTMDFSWMPDMVKIIAAAAGATGVMLLLPAVCILRLVAWYRKRRGLSAQAVS